MGITQILSFPSGVTQILALGNAKIYQHVGISNAKFWHQSQCPTPTPDARYFASQWNIGFSVEVKWNDNQNEPNTPCKGFIYYCTAFRMI